MKNFLIVSMLLANFANAYAQTYEERLGASPVGEVKQGIIQLPVLTWGADAATFISNGNTVLTSSKSVFDNMGLKFNLVNGDDFNQQVKNYLSGKTPYLRGTARMVSAASELLNKDDRTKPVMVLQLSFSLGDHIVAREEIKTLNDLKGKKIAIQLPIGPHLGLIQDSLDAAQLSVDDVILVPCADLTGAGDSPVSKFRKDPTIAACCVISPDMLGLTSGLTSIGNGAEGTVKGAHVLNSTSTMSRSIVDGYWVRKDYYTANKEQVEKFVIGYLHGAEQLIKIKDAYKDGRGSSPQYVALMKVLQKFYGEDVLPTIENDVHGLICDANIVRIPGNELYFNDPNNPVGFESKLKSGSDFALKLKYTKNATVYEKAKWDYKKISESVGVKYVKPEFAQGRVDAEALSFEGLEDDVILSFEVKFAPQQSTFSEEEYGEKFAQVCKNSVLFGNGVIVVKGHSDTYFLLKEFFRAAKVKGLITGASPNYKFKGKPLDLTNIEDVVNIIRNESFGNNLTDTKGVIEDPKRIATSAQSLSFSRAEAVKRAIEKYAKEHKINVDFSQIQPTGAGVSEPKFPRPMSNEEMAENRRVEFLVIKAKSESIKGDDFNFDK